MLGEPVLALEFVQLVAVRLVLDRTRRKICGLAGWNGRSSRRRSQSTERLHTHRRMWHLRDSPDRTSDNANATPTN